METDETFLKEIHNSAFEWYKQADTKAQIILGFTGIFLSIITASLLSIPADSKFSQYLGEKDIIVGLLSLAIFCFCISIGFSALALWGRGVFRGKEKGICFFGQIANYENVDELKKDITSIRNTEEYIDQLRSSVLIFSKNTKLKHRLVNLAVICSGVGLISTVGLAFIIFLA